MNRIAGLTPVNRQAAALVYGKNEEGPQRRTFADVDGHWETPPVLGNRPQEFRDLSGIRFGRFTVVGYFKQEGETLLHPSAARALWLCKCACGRYETRKAKAILGPSGSNAKCIYCQHYAVRIQPTTPEIVFTAGSNIDDHLYVLGSDGHPSVCGKAMGQLRPKGIPAKVFHWAAMPQTDNLPNGVEDLVGRIRGKLTVVAFFESSPRGQEYNRWVLRCKCGRYETRTTSFIERREDGPSFCYQCVAVSNKQPTPAIVSASPSMKRSMKASDGPFASLGSLLLKR